MRFTKILAILTVLSIAIAGAMPAAAQGKGGGGKGGGGKGGGGKGGNASATSASKAPAKAAAKKSGDGADGADRKVDAATRRGYAPIPPKPTTADKTTDDGADGAGRKVDAATRRGYAPVPPKPKTPVKAPVMAKPPVISKPPLAKGSTLLGAVKPPVVTPKPLGPIKPPPGVIKPAPKVPPLHPAFPSVKHPHRFWRPHTWISSGGGSSSIVNLYGDVDVGCFEVGCAECGCEIIAVFDQSDNTFVNPSVAVPAAAGLYDLVVVCCPGDDQCKTIWLRR